MLHPSYSDLMDVVNSGAEDSEHPVVNSRYSIVLATAKRARQLVDGASPLIDDAFKDGKPKKALSIAVEEVNSGTVKILSEEDTEE